ncbi:MAG: RNB domain-containing ribonuclease, partial [Anaerolineales bacterium]
MNSMHGEDQHQRGLLQRIARRVMFERGLLPDFSPAALAELGKMSEQEPAGDAPVLDLRKLLWASIDNDDSRDL